MSDDKLNDQDPAHHEGDQTEEMTEEGSPVEPESASSETDLIDRELEIFQDLQRLQADFVNYRARVERDRGAERQAAIATKLRNAGDKFGLVSFGVKGDKFDPELHDALVQTPNPSVSQAEIADVIELGYRIGERMLRPAKVAVFVPAE